MNEYKDLVCEVESGYSFSLLFDVEKLPEDKGCANSIKFTK